MKSVRIKLGQTCPFEEDLGMYQYGWITSIVVKEDVR